MVRINFQFLVRCILGYEIVLDAVDGASLEIPGSLLVHTQQTSLVLDWSLEWPLDWSPDWSLNLDGRSSSTHHGSDEPGRMFLFIRTNEQKIAGMIELNKSIVRQWHVLDQPRATFIAISFLRSRDLHYLHNVWFKEGIAKNYGNVSASALRLSLLLARFSSRGN
jgi:hypothetical protein